MKQKIENVFVGRAAKLKHFSYVMAQASTGLVAALATYNEDGQDENISLASQVMSTIASISLASYSIFDVINKRETKKQTLDSAEIELQYPNTVTANIVAQVASEALLTASVFMVNDISREARIAMAVGGFAIETISHVTAKSFVTKESQAQISNLDSMSDNVLANLNLIQEVALSESIEVIENKSMEFPQIEHSPDYYIKQIKELTSLRANLIKDNKQFNTKRTEALEKIHQILGEEIVATTLMEGLNCLEDLVEEKDETINDLREELGKIKQEKQELEQRNKNEVKKRRLLTSPQ
jgi:hypothetical protein